MKCTKCDYSLWNLPEPRCPECGESFNVEDWTFESGTVRFHCNACDHPLMHRQPGYGPARCSNCNEVIAWSDVRVMPVNERAEEATTRGWRWTGVPLWWQMAGLVLALLLMGVLVPTLTMRPSQPSLAAHAAFVITFGFAAIVGVRVAPPGTRRRTAVVWLCILGLLSGLTIRGYLDASARWQRFVAWRIPYNDFWRLDHLSAQFIAETTGPHDLEQFRAWLTGKAASAVSYRSGLFRLSLVNDLKPMPEYQDWMRSGAMYVDARALFQQRYESHPNETIVIAFAVVDDSNASFVILNDDGHVRRVFGSDWISDQAQLRSRLGLSPLPALPNEDD
jgi:hypothetical protein